MTYSAEKLKKQADAYLRDDGSENQFEMPKMLRYAADVIERQEQVTQERDRLNGQVEQVKAAVASLKRDEGKPGLPKTATDDWDDGYDAAMESAFDQLAAALQEPNT